MPGERKSLHGHLTLREVFVRVENTQPRKTGTCNSPRMSIDPPRGGLDVSGRDKNGFVGRHLHVRLF